MSAAQITLDAVGVQLGAQAALTGVSLRIEAGERVALVGANGSGKSTLLRTLHGLVLPSQGQVQLAPGVRQAMLFQRPHLLRWSALNNVALGLWLDRARGLKWLAAQAMALQALHRVGLQSVAQQTAASCPVVSSNAWPWPAPGHVSPMCCCWTSPPPASTRMPSVRWKP